MEEEKEKVLNEKVDRQRIDQYQSSTSAQLSYDEMEIEKQLQKDIKERDAMQKQVKDMGAYNSLHRQRHNTNKDTHSTTNNTLLTSPFSGYCVFNAHYHIIFLFSSDC